MATHRGFKNNPDAFCYICGEFTNVPNRKRIDDSVDNLYHAYFGMKLGNQDRSCAPHILCKACVEHLRQWKNDKCYLLKSSLPMIWREPQNHHDDRYFCAFDLVGLNKRTKKSTKFTYPSLKSAIRPVAHSDDLPIPVFKESVLSDIEPFKHYDETSDSSDINQDDNFFAISNQPQLFDQKELKT